MECTLEQYDLSAKLISFLIKDSGETQSIVLNHLVNKFVKKSNSGNSKEKQSNKVKTGKNIPKIDSKSKLTMISQYIPSFPIQIPISSANPKAIEKKNKGNQRSSDNIGKRDTSYRFGTESIPLENCAISNFVVNRSLKSISFGAKDSFTENVSDDEDDAVAKPKAPSHIQLIGDIMNDLADIDIKTEYDIFSHIKAVSDGKRIQLGSKKNIIDNRISFIFDLKSTIRELTLFCVSDDYIKDDSIDFQSMSYSDYIISHQILLTAISNSEKLTSTKEFSVVANSIKKLIRSSISCYYSSCHLVGDTTTITFIKKLFKLINLLSESVKSYDDSLFDISHYFMENFSVFPTEYDDSISCLLTKQIDIGGHISETLFNLCSHAIPLHLRGFSEMVDDQIFIFHGRNENMMDLMIRNASSYYGMIELYSLRISFCETDSFSLTISNVGTPLTLFSFFPVWNMFDQSNKKNDDTGFIDYPW